MFGQQVEEVSPDFSIPVHRLQLLLEVLMTFAVRMRDVISPAGPGSALWLLLYRKSTRGQCSVINKTQLAPLDSVALL